jgi:hypothetical protein
MEQKIGRHEEAKSQYDITLIADLNAALHANVKDGLLFPVWRFSFPQM